MFSILIFLFWFNFIFWVSLWAFFFLFLLFLFYRFCWFDFLKAFNLLMHGINPMLVVCNFFLHFILLLFQIIDLFLFIFALLTIYSSQIAVLTFCRLFFLIHCMDYRLFFFLLYSMNFCSHIVYISGVSFFKFQLTISQPLHFFFKILDLFIFFF